jgi:hypothetical protein
VGNGEIMGKVKRRGEWGKWGKLKGMGKLQCFPTPFRVLLN